MSDGPIDRDRVPPAFGFKIPLSPKLRRPSIFAGLPPDVISHLGEIAVLWGMFETSFEKFLQALLRANRSAEARWHRFSFEQKEQLFRNELKRAFDSYPTISLYIRCILADAKHLQAKRNLLLHGKLMIEIKTKEDVYQQPDVAIIATGRRKKQKISERFTFEGIEDLFYNLCHLGGRMTQFDRPPAPDFLLNVAWQDKCFLLDFLKNNHPDHTNPPTLPPRPKHLRRDFNFVGAIFSIVFHAQFLIRYNA